MTQRILRRLCHVQACAKVYLAPFVEALSVMRPFIKRAATSVYSEKSCIAHEPNQVSDVPPPFSGYFVVWLLH